jgi:hypothetical protein
VADSDNRTEGDRFSSSVPPRSQPYTLKGEHVTNMDSTG